MLLSVWPIIWSIAGKVASSHRPRCAHECRSRRRKFAARLIFNSTNSLANSCPSASAGVPPSCTSPSAVATSEEKLDRRRLDPSGPGDGQIASWTAFTVSAKGEFCAALRFSRAVIEPAAFQVSWPVWAAREISDWPKAPLAARRIMAFICTSACRWWRESRPPLASGSGSGPRLSDRVALGLAEDLPEPDRHVDQPLLQREPEDAAAPLHFVPQGDGPAGFRDTDSQRLKSTGEDRTPAAIGRISSPAVTRGEVIGERPWDSFAGVNQVSFVIQKMVRTGLRRSAHRPAVRGVRPASRSSRCSSHLSEPGLAFGIVGHLAKNRRIGREFSWPTGRSRGERAEIGPGVWRVCAALAIV